MKRLLLALIPAPLLNLYHFILAGLGTVVYGFPSRKLFVIGVTGTKGKSTVTELVAAVLREAGYKVAVASTIRFAVGDESEPNLFKMSMPGRFFLQRFLHKAVNAGCTHAVMEMTSEGAAQHRHRAIALDALIFTNITPEHIESHGSFEKYLAAKLLLARHLERSPKRPRYIVVNADDTFGEQFVVDVEIQKTFSLQEAQPYSVDDRSVRFLWRGDLWTVPLPGLFNLKNVLATLALGEAMGLSPATLKRALEKVHTIPGRAERVEAGQPFTVVVDYAHTADSLRALYETYRSLAKPRDDSRRVICVLGATGGGRDKWKRPEMGKVADEYCDLAILTDDDPYDENSESILEEIAQGFTNHTPRLVVDRHEAIAQALFAAHEGDVVLVTGKGTDPYLMKAQGQRIPWSDKKVVQEELAKLGYH